VGIFRLKKKYNNMIYVAIMMTQFNAGGVNMKSSLEKLGWDVTTLGLGEKWTGWTMRMTKYAEFAESKPFDSIIVFIDAYDALAVRTPNGFKELFESFNSDLIIGAENFCGGNCVEIRPWWSEHANIKENYGNENVQGGCVVGRAHALSLMYRWCISNNIHDDQIGISTYINEQKPKNVMLDYENKICFHDNYGSTGEFSIDENSLIKITRRNLTTTPFFVHFPGFLVWRSIPVIHTIKIPELKNYNFAAKHVLKTDFVEIGQMDSGTSSTWNIAIIVFISILLALFIIFVILFGLYYYRNRKKKSVFIKK
jgi:hypothetical protein